LLLCPPGFACPRDRRAPSPPRRFTRTAGILFFLLPPFFFIL
jgi:hypothetical protein